MTIPRLLEMSEYWKKRPPLHEMVAAYLGITKSGVARPDSVSADEAGMAFLRDFVAAGGQVPADIGVG